MLRSPTLTINCPNPMIGVSQPLSTPLGRGITP